LTATSPAVSTPSEASLPDDLKIALVSTWPSFQAVHARSISHHSASQQIGLGVVNRPARGRVLGGCHTLVNGSTAESLWHSGDWQINAFSSDGRFGVGRSVMYGTIGIIDLNTDKLVLGINPDMTPVGPDMIFDEANRLNFTVGNPASGARSRRASPSWLATWPVSAGSPPRAMRIQRLRIAEPQVTVLDDG
jgi:hypothetical protein